MKSTTVLNTIYSLLVENAITLFVIALLTMVAYQFRSNTLIVSQVCVAAMLGSTAPPCLRR